MPQNPDSVGIVCSPHSPSMKLDRLVPLPSKASRTINDASTNCHIGDASAACVAVLDNKGCITAHNHAWPIFAMDIGLATSQEWEGYNFLSKLETLQPACHSMAGCNLYATGCLKKILTGELQSSSFIYQCGKPEEPHWYRAHFSALNCEQQRLVVVMFYDISDSIQTKQQLFQMAHFDPLTGLPNRMLFLDRLQNMLDLAQRTERKMAVLYIDMDHFKQVNDQLGHHAGDLLLQQFSHRMNACIRRSDTLGRLGGDEFALLLPETKNPDDIALVAKKLLDALSQPFQLFCEKVICGASIGIAIFPDDASTADELMRFADEAMYEIKTGGRNGYRFFSEKKELLTNDLHPFSKEDSFPAVDNSEPQQHFDQETTRRELLEKELAKCSLDLASQKIILSETVSQLQQSERLASIGELAAGISQELIAPLVKLQKSLDVIKTHSDKLLKYVLLVDKAEGDHFRSAWRTVLIRAREEIDIPAIRDMQSTVFCDSQTTIDSISALIQSMNGLSLNNAASQWQWTDLHDCLDTTIMMIANLTRYRADIIKDYGTLPMVQCQPSQISQVFINLLVNAVDAMDKNKGSIVVRTGANSDTVWIQFTDDGKGMSEDLKSKIFSPFFTTKTAGQGTGLGLPIAYEIIKHHNGRIELESKENSGSTFRIVLPIKQPVTI